MSTVAAAFSYNSPPVGPPTPIACTASWDGNDTLTDTVTATGQVVVKISGQCLIGLAVPLVAFASGNPA